MQPVEEFKRNICNLEKLYISHNAIDGSDAYQIAKILSHYTKLRELDFSFNCLEAKGAAKIFGNMYNYPNLEKINISHNSITFWQ